MADEGHRVKLLSWLDEDDLARAELCAVITHSTWSGPSVIMKQLNLKLLEETNFPGEIWVLTVDKMRADDQNRLFGMLLQGNGEAFIVEKGKIVFSWKRPGDLKRWLNGK